jgi:hypothetical protein
MTYCRASTWTTTAPSGDVSVTTSPARAVCPGTLSRGDVAWIPAVVQAGSEVDGIHERAVH